MSKSVDNKAIIQSIALAHFAGVKPRLMQVLLNRYGSLEHIFSANAGSLMAIDGMTTDQANRISQAYEEIDEAETYYKLMLQSEISLISRFEHDYPQRFFELNDPPTFLYYRGELPSNDSKLVSVSGSSQPSNEGIELTTNVSKKLAALQVETISSLNSGIDSAVHLGTKASEGKSYALLDCGFDNIYPEENRPLAIDIVSSGGLITEFPPNMKFDQKKYKASNRLIAGISQALILTEFYKEDEITLDLLECCLQIGKMVFVIIDPKFGGLTDKSSLDRAVSCGAIPMVGLEKIDDIVKSLV